MTDKWAQSEAERTQANMIRVGRVTEVDAVAGKARVQVGGFQTDWLPWAVSRAGSTRTASAPSVGEQRLIFAPYGDTGQAIIGQALYQDDYPEPTNSATQDVAVFADGTRVEYDSEANRLQIDVAGTGLVVINCKQATVSADSVTLDAPETSCTGNLTVDGNAKFNGDTVEHSGTNIGKDHTHSGVQTGSGTTGPPS